jgi:hypothetical protein
MHFFAVLYAFEAGKQLIRSVLFKKLKQKIGGLK